MSVSPPLQPPMSRRNSPPTTPPLSGQRPTSTTPSDDSSIIEELSFDFTLDDDGQYVRLNKRSSGSKSPSYSPPTPTSPPNSFNESSNEKQPQPSPPQHLKPPSPSPAQSSNRPVPLSRSESAHVLDSVSSAAPQPTSRSFKRVASVPASITPANASSLSAYPTPLPSTAAQKLRTISRRVTLEDHKNNDNKEYDIRSRAIDPDIQHEKENLGSTDDDGPSGSGGVASYAAPTLATSNRLHSSPVPSTRGVRPTRSGPARSRPLSDVIPVPQRERERERALRQLASRGVRPVKPVKFNGTGFDKISEVESSEGEQKAHDKYDFAAEDTDTGADESPASVPLNSTTRQRSYAGFTSLSQSSSNRPRRSASLSDASTQEDRLSLPAPPPPPQSYMRPVSSQGLNARRVTVEEKERQEQDYQKFRRETEEAERRAQGQEDAHYSDRMQEYERETRQSPSPTHQQRPSYAGHRRRDSDTLRSAVENAYQQQAPPPLPTQPLTPALAAATSRHTSPRESGGHSPGSDNYPPSSVNGVSGASARHRRSPIGTEIPTTKQPQQIQVQQQQQPQQIQVQQQQQQYAPSAPDVRSRQMIVNKKPYARLDMIGKGGSSRVYRVLSHANELYAIKRVSLDKTDAETMSGYMNEIALLKRLDGNSRIIRLIDSEVKAGPGGSKGHLLLVMECGEVDLARLLSEQQKEPMNMVWISYYWQQMLQAVHVIHEEKIVHSDLKPANFVLVKGQLKLIDFGIANAIANDTTNIQRDHQIGTVNYMSPEAIELPDGMRRLKVGRPSDVWSLGCILYQMVYGQPPFQHLSVYQKMKAIPDMTHVIEFPEYSTPSIPASNRNSSSPGGGSAPPRKLDHLKRRVRRDVIRGIQNCLNRNPKERATIPELMEQDWLAMTEPERPAVKDILATDETVINPFYMRQLLQYGISLGQSQNVDMSAEKLLREAERLVAELKALEP